ncbi:dockerin type I domain-containing protein [Rubripirellula amarantea]|nr:dockerin type I domain-containing protein [Rubripirellula amarantea]
MADDGTSASTMDIEIVVLNKNQSPVISSLVDRSVREGDKLSFTLSASDPEGDSLRYSAVALPIGATINPVTGRFEWTPRFNQHGTYGLKFQVSDGELTATTSLTIVVDNVNGPVTIADIPRRVIYEGQPLEIYIDAVDPDNPYAPPTLAPDGTFDVAGFDAPPINFTLTDFPIDAEFISEAQLIRWTPSFDAAGRYEIGITVMDDGDGNFGATSATRTLIIDVLDVNSPPVVTPIAFQNVNGDESLVIPIEAIDPEGNPVAISAGYADLIVGQLSPLPDFMSIVDNGDGTASLTVTPSLTDRGDYAITIQATDDGNGNSANIATGEYTFNVSVDVVNAPPVLTPIPNLVAVVGQPLSFTIDVDDLDQDPLLFDHVGLPAGASLVASPRYGEAILSWTPTAGDVGEHPVEIVVSDSGNLGQTLPLEDRQNITITVRASNTAPNLTPIAIPSVAEGNSLAFTLAASDSDGDDVFFTATGLPAGAKLNSITGEVTYSPGFESAGNYTFTATASDGNATSSSEFSFTVTQTNRPPSLSVIPPVAGFEGSEIVVSIAAFDLDGGTPIVTIPGLPDGAFLETSQSGLISLRWPTDFGDAGQYDLTVVATDASGLSASTPLTINVSPINQRPVISPTGGRVAVVGEELRVAIVVTDADNDGLTFIPRNLPAGAVLNPTNGVFRWTPSSLDLGEYNVVVEVSDGSVTQLEVLRIVVADAPIEPAVRVELTPSFPALPGQTVTLQPVGSGIAPIESVSVSVRGNVLPLDALGRATFTPTRPGRYEVVATATDVQGIVGTSVTAVLVRDPADVAPPNVGINLAPATTVQVGKAIEINVQDRNLDTWTLTLRNLRGGEARTIATGTSTGSNMVATNLDAADLSDGVYELVLSATDISGRTSTTSETFQVRATSNTGVYVQTAIDRSLDFGDIQVPLTLRYRSSDAGIDTGLGDGWSWAAVNASPITLTDVPEGGDDEALRDGSFLHLVAPDGTDVVYRFGPQRLAGTSGAGSVYVPGWTAFGTSDWTLATDDVTLQEADGSFYRVADGLPYQPELIQLTDALGQTYLYNSQGDLTKVTSGVSTIDWYGGEAIADNGSRLTIRRNDDGRITSLTGLSGVATRLRYDGDLLSSLTDGSDRALFSYSAGRLTQALSSQAGQSVGVSYNEDGSLNSTVSIDEFLGGLRDAAASTVTGSLGSGESSSIAFALTAEELTTGNNGVALVGISVTGSGGFDPAVPTIDGLAGTSVQVRSGFASALFPVSASGGVAAAIAGAGASTGNYSVDVYIAGDLDGDGDVDGIDRSNITAQFGLVPGDGGYNPAADVNRDGVIDSTDVELQAINFGFVADLSPVATDGSGITLPGLPVDIDLSENAIDPEGSPLDFQVVSTTGGTARLLADGRTVRFTPSSAAGGLIEFTASDLVGQSNTAQFTIDIESRTVSSLQITTTDIQIGVGGAASVDVDAVLADGTTFDLPNSAVTFDVTDSIAVVTPTGTVGGIAQGNGLITATAFGLTAATSLRVGEDTERTTFDIYPTNYALELGQTRQFFVRERNEDGSVTDRASDPDTFYVIADPTIGTITQDGLFTPIALGTTQVTVIREGVSEVAEILIAAPSLGATTVGEEGGLVATDDGSIIIGIGPGTFEDATTVTVTEIAETAFAGELPAGFTFSTGFSLDMGDSEPTSGLSLTGPADASLSPGDPMFIFRESQIFNFDTQAFETQWQLVDSMVVGGDGVARSTSPPNPAVNAGGSFAMAIGLSTGSLSGLAVGMTIDAGILAARSGSYRVEVEPQSGRPFFFVPGQFLDAALPIAGPDYNVNVTVFDPAFNFSETVFGAGYTPGGTRTQLVEPSQPFTTDTQPTVQQIGYGVEAIGDFFAPVLTLTGSNFSPDVDLNQVLFFRSELLDLGDEELAEQSPGIILSVTPTELRVIPPEGFAIGGGFLRVDSIQDQIFANPGGDDVLIPQVVKGEVTGIELGTPYYSAVANSGSDTVSILDIFFSSDNASRIQENLTQQRRDIVDAERDTTGLRDSNNLLVGPVDLVSSVVAEIQVGRGPTDVVMDPSGLRAYVANSSEGSVSIIDLLSLQEVDLDPTTPEIDRLMPGFSFQTDARSSTFQPYYLAVHPTIPIGVVTDRSSSTIAWFRTDTPQTGDSLNFIDLDPDNNLLSRIGSSESIRSLTDIEFVDDGRYLVVNTTGASSWAGADTSPTVGGTIVIELDPDLAFKFDTLQTFSIDPDMINIVGTGYKPFGLRDYGDGKVGIAVRGGESVRIVDVRKANSLVRTPTNLRSGEGQLPESISFSGGRDAAFRYVQRNLFSIDSPEDIVIAPPLPEPIAVRGSDLVINELGLVLMNQTYNGPNQIASSPEFGGGGNIGILANPRSDNPVFIGATQKVPYSWPDQIDIGPDQDSILASFKGTNQVLVYDYSILVAVLQIMAVDNPNALLVPFEPIENFADRIQTSVTRQDFINAINSDDAAEDENNVLAEQFLELRARVRNQSLLRGVIPTGRLPSGIAPGPIAPADIIGISGLLEQPVEEDDDTILEIRYTILGDTAKPFELTLYASTNDVIEDEPTGPPEERDLLLAEFSISSPEDLTPGDHVIRLEMTGVPPTGTRNHFIAHLDSSDTNDEERSEDNNYVRFRPTRFKLEAFYDGNEEPLMFGQFIEGVELINTFTIDVGVLQGKVESATVFVVPPGETPEFASNPASFELTPYSAQSRIWGGDYNVGLLIDSPDLYLRLETTDDARIDEVYEAETIAKPVWLTEGDDVAVVFEFQYSSERYVISRREKLFGDFKTVPEGVLGIGGQEFGAAGGAAISFAFDLEGIASSQRIGPYLETKLFGVDTPPPLSLDLSIPAGIAGGLGAPAGNAILGLLGSNTQIAEFDTREQGISPIRPKDKLATTRAVSKIAKTTGSNIARRYENQIEFAQEMIPELAAQQQAELKERLREGIANQKSKFADRLGLLSRSRPAVANAIYATQKRSSQVLAATAGTRQTIANNISIATEVGIPKVISGTRNVYSKLATSLPYQAAARAAGYGDLVDAAKKSKKLSSALTDGPTSPKKFGLSSSSKKIAISPLDIRTDLKLNPGGGIELEYTTPGLQFTLTKSIPLGPPLFIGPVPVARLEGYVGLGINAALKLAYSYAPVATNGELIPVASGIKTSLPLELQIFGGFRGKALEGLAGTLDLGITGSLTTDLLKIFEPGAPKVGLNINALGSLNFIVPSRTIPLFATNIVNASDITDASSYRYPPVIRDTLFEAFGGNGLQSASGGILLPSSLAPSSGIGSWTLAGLPTPAEIEAFTRSGSLWDNDDASTPSSLVSDGVAAMAIPLAAIDDDFNYLGSTVNPINQAVTLADVDDVALFRFHQVNHATIDDRIEVLATDPNAEISLTLLSEADFVIERVSGVGNATISLEGLPAGSYGIVIQAPGDLAVGEVSVSVDGPSTLLPDLVADLHPLPEVITVDQETAMTWTVTNAGAISSTPTTARLVISRDVEIELGDALLGSSVSIPALAPGERFTVTVPVRLPNSADYTAVGLMVDPYALVNQSSRDNDSYRRPIDLQLLPDFFEPNDSPETSLFLLRPVENFVLPGLSIASILDDDFYRFYHDGTGGRIILRGDQDDQTIAAQLLGIDGEVFSPPSSIAQAPGSELVIDLEDVPPGEYYLYTFSDIPMAYEIEFDVAELSDRPNLQLIEGVREMELSPGASFTYPVTLANYASASAPITVLTSVVVDDIEYSQGTTSVPALSHNQTIDLELPLVVPIEAADSDATYRIVVETVDDDGTTVRTSFDVPFTGTSVVDDYELEEIARGGVVLGTFAGIDSVDDLAISTRHDIDNLSFETPFDSSSGGYVIVSGDDVSTLLPIAYGPQGTVVEPVADGANWRFDLPVAGSYLLQVRSQSEAEIFEPVNYNVQWNYPDLTQSNLAIAGVNLNQGVIDSGSTFTMDVAVLNNGSVSSSPGLATVYLSDDENIDPATDVVIASNLPYGAIDADTTESFSFSINLPAGLSPGLRFLGVAVETPSAETSVSDNQSEPILFAVNPDSDLLESNDTPATATIIPALPEEIIYEDLTITRGDVDYFAFSLAGVADVDDAIVVAYDASEGFLQTLLYDDEGTIVWGSEAVAGGSVLSLGGLPAGNYMIEVRGVADAVISTGYSMELFRNFTAEIPLLSERSSDGAIVPVPTGPTQQTSLQRETVERLIDSATQRWGSDLVVRDITAVVADLAPGYLGFADITSWSDDGVPLSGTITVDIDADGHGWFVDDTPLDDSEFTRQYAGGDALGRPGESRYDLLTMLMHEVGHLAGFTDSYAGFASLVNMENGVASISTSQGNVILQSDLDHIATGGQPFDLMNASLRPGLRKLPTAIDAEILSLAYAADTSGYTEEQRLALTAGSGFVSITSGEVLTVATGPAIGLTNEDLLVSDPAADGFGWRTVGDVQISEGVATISETVGLIGDLSQTFVVPNGTTTLKFTLGGINLDVASGPFPSEAFEVSLLSAGDEAASLLGGLNGLFGGDAILNIQADGTVYTAPGVTVEGLSQSGGVIDLSQTFDVVVAIPDGVGGQTATLFFDLVGFGEASSTAQVTAVSLDAGDEVQTWTNPTNRFDVNANGSVTALDALVIINQIGIPTVHNPETGVLFAIAGQVGPPPFYDVSGDGRISALDALQIINELAREGTLERPTWTNSSNRFDVNDNGSATASDALAIINELAIGRVHDPETGRLDEITDEVGPPPYYDVTGDGRISALDALQIINHMAIETSFNPESVDDAVLQLMADQENE